MTRSRPSLTIGLSILLLLVSVSFAQQPCSQLATGGEDEQNKMLLCQLFESSNLLAQLGALVSEGLERVMLSQGVTPTGAEEVGPVEQKRKHEYLRFGKRKHEYLRFGKRKHEYLRFGRK